MLDAEQNSAGRRASAAPHRRLCQLHCQRPHHQWRTPGGPSLCCLQHHSDMAAEASGPHEHEHASASVPGARHFTGIRASVCFLEVQGLQLNSTTRDALRVVFSSRGSYVQVGAATPGSDCMRRLLAPHAAAWVQHDDGRVGA